MRQPSAAPEWRVDAAWRTQFARVFEAVHVEDVVAVERLRAVGMDAMVGRE